MPYIFEHADVYKRAISFADKVLFLTEDVGGEDGILAELLAQEAVSISMRIAEGVIVEAEKACRRCIPLLNFLEKQRFMGVLTSAALRAEVERILSMLVGSPKEEL